MKLEIKNHLIALKIFYEIEKLIKCIISNTGYWEKDHTILSVLQLPFAVSH